MERHLGVTVTDENPRTHHVSKTLAALYRATMLSLALRGTVATEKNNFWKVGCIAMSVVSVALLLLAVFH